MRIVSHTGAVLRRLPFVAALLALLGASCSLSVDYSRSRFVCPDNTCPDGFQCVAGLCEPKDGPDAAVPVIIDASVDAPPGTPDAEVLPQCNGVDQALDPSSGHCYTLDRTARTWVNAASACNALGPTSHLAFVTSSAENQLVAFIGGGTAGLTWLGGTDGPTEGDWIWLDGSDFPPSPLPNVYSFSAWNVNEPNNGNGGTPENCLAIQLSSSSSNRGGWDDRACNSTRPAVCETE